MTTNSDNNHLGSRRALADATAGVIGSLVSLYAFYPIEVWKTNLQATSSSASSTTTTTAAYSSTKRSIATNNRSISFQGCQTKTLHTMSSSFCYFYVYSIIFNFWKKRSNNTINTSTRLVLTALAAMVNTIVTLPLDVLSSKHVTTTTTPITDEIRFDKDRKLSTYSSIGDDDNDDDDDDSDTDDEEYHDTITESSQHQLQEEKEKKDDKEVFGGNNNTNRRSANRSNEYLSRSSLRKLSWKQFWSLWKGLAPALLLCTNPSINYTIFDMAKTKLMKVRKHSSSSLSMPEAFLVGLFAKFVATVATYPLIRAKVIMMVVSSSENSLIGTLCTTYKEEGFRGLYKGLDFQLLHTVLKSGLMMMVREKISNSTKRLIVGEETSKR